MTDAANPVDTSPVLAARAALGGFVDAVAQAQRIESMQAAARAELLVLAFETAERSADAFASPSLAPGERREMARRAVIADLATACRLPERTMDRLVSEAIALTTVLTATHAALRAGDLTYAHARVVIDETVDLADRPVLQSELEAALVAAAQTCSAAALRRRAPGIRERLEVEHLDVRHARALDARRIEVAPAADGMAWLHLLVAASDAHLVADRVARLANEAAVPGDERSAAQRRADAARDLLLEGVPPAGHPLQDAAARVRPTVHVTVPVLTLLGSSDDPGELRGYGPIDARSARRLAAQAPSFTRLLTDPVDGVVRDVDRTVYRVPADMKRLLEVRDATCRFPGCARTVERCDVDHTVDWADGGRTSVDNLAHLCRHHHRLKHETTWQVRRLGDGALEWTAPSGRRHRDDPAPPPCAPRRDVRLDGVPFRAAPPPFAPPF